MQLYNVGEMFLAGVASASLVELSRLSCKLLCKNSTYRNIPAHIHVIVSVINIVIGGGTTALFTNCGPLTFLPAAAAIGCGAPAILRSLSTIGVRLVSAFTYDVESINGKLRIGGDTHINQSSNDAINAQPRQGVNTPWHLSDFEHHRVSTLLIAMAW